MRYYNINKNSNTQLQLITVITDLKWRRKEEYWQSSVERYNLQELLNLHLAMNTFKSTGQAQVIIMKYYCDNLHVTKTTSISDRWDPKIFSSVVTSLSNSKTFYGLPRSKGNQDPNR